MDGLQRAQQFINERLESGISDRSMADLLQATRDQPDLASIRPNTITVT